MSSSSSSKQNQLIDTMIPMIQQLIDKKRTEVKGPENNQMVKDEKIISYFIRQQKLKLNDSIIPECIVMIFFLYYHTGKEEFEFYDKSITINNDIALISVNPNQPMSYISKCSLFCANICYHGIHEFEIKLLNYGVGGIDVGICDEQTSLNEFSKSAVRSTENEEGIYPLIQRYDKLQQNDTIQIILNLHEFIIYLKINGKNVLKKVNIKKNIGYKFTIGLSIKSIIKLIKYQNKL